MELKEIAIIFINAIATTFGFSGPLYMMHLVLTREKFKIREYLHIYLILYIVNIIASLTAFSYLPFVYTIAAFAYFTIKRRKMLGNIVSCLSAVAIFFVLMAIDNIIILAMGFSSDQIVAFRHTIYYNAYNSLIFLVLTCVVMFIINCISKHIQNTDAFSVSGESRSNIRLIIFITVSIMFFVIVIATTWFAAMIDTQHGLFYTGFTIALSVLFALFVGFSLYIMVKMIEQKRKEMEVKYNEDIANIYRNEVKNIYDNIREFKHDYMKIYSSMSILIEQNRIGELKSFFYNKIIPFQNEIMNESDIIQKITLLDDMIIQGLIYSYIIKSRNDNINFVISINENIPIISNKIDTLDLVRVLGILLDNAFEEVEKIKSKSERTVEFAAVMGQKLVFVVRNQCASTPNMSEIFKKDYSTKGRNHGIGLTTARDIMKKYDNVYMRIRLDNDRFIAEVHTTI